MKRKHDEGYALVFALVVLLFLSIVAMFLMQLAGRDLSAQQASIDRMKNQYEAQGKIEEIVGKLENNTGTTPLTDIFGAGVTVTYANQSGVVTDVSLVTATMEISSNDGSVTISCTLQLRGTFEIGGTMLNGPCRVEYLTYNVNSNGSSEGGGS